MDIGSESKMEMRIPTFGIKWWCCYGMRNIKDEQFRLGTQSSLMTTLRLRCPLDIQGELSS